MKVSANAKFIGTSARKVGLVAGLIRGRQASEAVVLLAHTPKRATNPVGKVLASAIANAENNHNLKVADLRIEQVLVGPGPSLKRMRPRARGSAARILHRSSHIQVILTDELVSQKSKVASRKTNDVKSNVEDAPKETK